MRGIFSVKKVNFCELFNKENSFKIPSYQRPFAWEREQVDDLWNDLINAKSNNYREYLLGTVYLKNEEKNSYEILDGQQRFTSMYLLLKALGKRKEDLPTLQLGGNDNEFFNNLLDSKRHKSKTASQNRLKEALINFEDKVKKFKNNKILDFIENNLSIIRTTVKDDDVAITTFITQTDRGKRLTNFEKLKSILLYYSIKIVDSSKIELKEIDELFGEIYISLNKLYKKPEIAESEVIRVLMIRMEQDYMYRDEKKYTFRRLAEDLIENKEKLYLQWEAGENSILFWIDTIFNILQNEQEELLKAISICLHMLREINEVLKLYAGNIDKNNILKNIFLSLNPSKFSKAFLTDYLYENQKKLFENIDFKEISLDEKDVKNIPEMPKDIEKEYPELNEYKQKIERNIKKYEKVFKEKTILNLIERLELSCWKIWKKPYADFLRYKKDKSLEHLETFVNRYKKEYFFRDMNYYNSYRYILIEYEAFWNKYFKIDKYYSVMLEDEEITKVQREHIFPQYPQEDFWEKIKNRFDNKTSYDEWIWEIGNIALLSKDDNIKESNKTPWEKAKGYNKQNKFNTTQQLGKDIKKYCGEDLNVIKKLLELRDYELKMFAWYRF